MPDATDQPAKPARSLTWFYAVMGVVIALTLFGTWFWTAWNVWWFDAAAAGHRQAAAAKQLNLPVETGIDLGDGVKLELVLIPAGRFRMGDQAGQDKDAGYQWVRITKPFYMGKHEVTQEVWQKVMGTNPSAFKGPKNPVEMVSWDECQEFLKKLARLAGGGLNALGKERSQFRLPTEAEWEWGCRAGTRTRFCSGDADGTLADFAWHDGNSGSTTHPVGTRQPNAWGLHDMHGNVWEWCGDWYGEYTRGWWPRADPTGPATGSARVLRGGAWDLDPGFCRSAYRSDLVPSYRDLYPGFRAVAVPVSAGP